jgi:hypothetical protein
MPRSNQTGEFNTFVGGLVTEASPLTFPENASIDEANFILKRDGSRERRLGMDYEAGLTPYPISYTISPIGDIAISAFEWNNVAGVAGKTFIVCQVHDKAHIIDRTDETLKTVSYVKADIALDTSTSTPERASFSSIDGKLVIAYGSRTIKVVSYYPTVDNFNDPTTGAIGVDKALKTRDLFGVADIVDSKDLLSPEYINLRPTSTADEDHHMYNLRNQGWAVPRLQWTGLLKSDPVVEFEDSGVLERGLPSNADGITLGLYANTVEADPNSVRFNDDGLAREEPTKSKAATGHYIIDLLDRGQSREAEYDRGCNPLTGLYINANPGSSPEYIAFRTPTVDLPVDRTQGGIKVVAEFAGRVFYGGFSSEVLSGDDQSPNLASYVFYSQQVQHESQITYCYQEGDPTSPIEPDLLDTDGGFIRLSGAYNIQAMVNIGKGLMVFAENGVWFIGGSDSGTFNANNQSVSKVTEHGTLASSSIVVVDGTVMYWSDDAIYHIKQTQVGDYSSEEVSVNIRTLYQSIADDSKLGVQGIFDSYSKTVRWMYNNTFSSLPATELIFDIVLGAFYPAQIASDMTTTTWVGLSKIPVVPIQVSPFNVATQELGVYVGADDVLSDVDDVVADIEGVYGGFRATSYLTLVGSEDPIATSITFSTYNNTEFKDWGTEDARAYMLTGYIGTGDYARFKQVPYVYFHFLRTEDGFTDSGDDFIPSNESSCLVQSQWDWTNSASYGKWGRQFQAYRYKRRYTPDDVFDTYDYGTTTIVSKNKLRGRGRVVSLLLETEAAKDLKLLGWSITIGSNTSV